MSQRPSAGFLVAQVVLGALAILVFLWLINILLGEYDKESGEYLGDPVLAGLAEALSATWWIGVCIGALAIIMIAEILLLRPTMREAVMDREAWQPQANAWQEPQAEPQHLIGCPGCGTVFDAEAHGRDTDGTFACPNCGRVGRIRKQEQPVESELREIDCPKCSHHYQAYQDDSECPNCGQHVRVRDQG